VASPLREPLSSEQETLLRIISEPLLPTGDWPVWQYADLTLARVGQGESRAPQRRWWPW
jgi:hypothetical protein